MNKEFLVSFFFVNGRISRGSLFYRLGVIGVACVSLGMLLGALFGNNGSALMAAIFVWSAIALAAQRLHDIGLSGWQMLSLLIPVLGPIYMVVQLLKKGAVGKNKYGNDPLTRAGYLMVDISQ